MNTATSSLKEKWALLKSERPHLRIRNAAQELEVSEVELLATQIPDSTIRLKTDMKEILSEVQTLGKVMGLTRNNECVHERKGVYLNPDFSSPHAGLFVNEDIDLRIFIGQWSTAFAVVEKTERMERKSLQFFGKDGEAIHKIYLTPASDEKAFDELVNKFKSDDQSPMQSVEKPVESLELQLEERMDEEIDVKGFQDDWENLQDTHNFYGLLKKYSITRTQALRLAPSEYYAKPIEKEAIVSMLETAASKQIPIMVFVGNKGNIQIHTGEVKKTMWHENWYNILDPDFNMHLDMTKVAQTWIVRKPTEDGEVTSIEVFNEMGEIIVQFFGKRKPGIPELTSWKELIASLS
ncbi:hemin-degrading factor [Flavobacterium sp. NKUCC04_CG]|uniref:hemin-degrading factor n=1 Tax=Flavobacterium sp. NKUCC04_CG TaxID=2842121 RepID=UPI001C5AE849|nr:ChuX/HutX family heme-like substrate-binding protein [Flavobacterium sp. NKUCC04_CG]MBW3518820.1 hemin-degrading factor [Flavobacterium sp. NKUCC04_CG]